MEGAAVKFLYEVVEQLDENVNFCVGYLAHDAILYTRSFFFFLCVCFSSRRLCQS